MFNRLIRSLNYTYDENGSQTGRYGYEASSYGYDSRNRQISYQKGNTSAAYTYRPDGLRASKSVTAWNGVITTTHYVWDGANMVYEYTTSATDGMSYLYGIGLLSRKNNGYTSIYLFNAHGDVTRIGYTEYVYDAFGNLINSNPNDTNPFCYCGEYYDEETGTYYLRARCYNPRNGRFTQEDPIGQGLNWYTYCANNPVMYIDPSGLAVTTWDAEYCSDEDVAWLAVITAQWLVATTDKERTDLHNQAEAIRNKYRIAGEYGTGDGNTVGNRQDMSIAAAALVIGGITTQLDSPLPGPADVVGGLIIAGGIIIGGIASWYAAQRIAKTIRQAETLTKEVVDILKKSPNDTLIFRHGGANPGNLIPTKNDVSKNSGLSFSTIPMLGSAVTTIGLVNATGVLTAVQDKPNHVAVYPVGTTLAGWREAGTSSIWTTTLKSIVVKF